MFPSQSLTDRRGLTLIELLVAVFIILLITAIAIPVMTPSLEERRIRETSRLVTGFIQGARTRAIQTGRPFGVIIEPLAGMPSAAVTLSYAEVQEPYAGDSVGSVVFVSGNGMIQAMGPAGTNSDVGWRRLVRPGDLIKFNYQGHLYRLFAGEPFHDSNANGIWNTGEPYADVNGDMAYTAPLTSPTPDLDANGFFSDDSLYVDVSDPSKNRHWYYSPVNQALDNVSGGLFTVTSVSGNKPFQIFRQPVKTSAPPLTLPEGMVIDLSGSGFGSVIFGPEPFNDTNGNRTRDASEAYTEIVNIGAWDPGLTGPFIILFSPSGSLAGIYHSVGSAPALSTTPIQLLIGKRDNVPATPAEGNENWRDLTNVWVSINPQTGLITTSPLSEDPTDADDVITSIGESLFYARRAQNMGGR